MNARRPRILLTNDDSHDSPLFFNAIDALAKLGDLSVAVPAEEQSWKGKSMTRFGPLYAQEIDIHGFPAWSITGTPADCVNLALYNLLDERPDFVVSGINIGKNVGLGFVLASGTVGACLEANIAGLPALALSQELAPDDFRYWSDKRAFRDETKHYMEALSARLIPIVWEEVVLPHDDEPITWNVNFPLTDTVRPEIVPTRLGHTWYEGCFAKRGDQYHHALQRADIDADEDTDDVVLQSGRVSLTRLDLRTFGQQI